MGGEGQSNLGQQLSEGRSTEIIRSQNWQGAFLEGVGFSVAQMAGKDRVPDTTDTLFPAHRGTNRLQDKWERDTKHNKDAGLERVRAAKQGVGRCENEEMRER